MSAETIDERVEKIMNIGWLLPQKMREHPQLNEKRFQIGYVLTRAVYNELHDRKRKRSAFETSQPARFQVLPMLNEFSSACDPRIAKDKINWRKFAQEAGINFETYGRIDQQNLWAQASRMVWSLAELYEKDTKLFTVTVKFAIDEAATIVANHFTSREEVIALFALILD